MNRANSEQNFRSRRSTVLLTAVLEASGWVIPVKLRNLSPEAALVEGEELPAVESILLFRRNDLAVKARVAWVAGKQAGLAFAKQLNADEMVRSVNRPAPRVMSAIRRPASRPLTD